MNTTHPSPLERLKAGNRRFVSGQRAADPEEPGHRQELTGGQHPYAIVLTCADSRVVPEFIFNARLGELFVVRVAGNVPNPSSLASIEYAVAQLGVKQVVVMGHSSCGAVGAAVQGGDAGPNLNHLVSFIAPAAQAHPGGSVDDVGRENVRNSVRSLVESSDILASAAADGSL